MKVLHVMNCRPRFFPAGVCSLLLFGCAQAWAQTANEVRVEMIDRMVELSTDNGNRWVRAQTNQALHAGDRLRTGPNSRAAVRLSPSTVVPFDELTEIAILPPETEGMEPGLHIFRGLLALFHKGKPKRFKVISPAATAGVDGTEFVMAVDSVNGRDRTTLAVIDGIVSLDNGRDAPLVLTNGERAVAEIGGAPVRIAGFVANNLLQWAFYFPAVLDLRDLALSPAEEAALGESLAAYRAGDLPGALDACGARDPASDAERIYKAALVLAVGQVTNALQLLAPLDQTAASNRNRRLANALRQQIAAVKREETVSEAEPQLTTELMAASYYEQSRARGDETLQRALEMARRATTNSPEFGFAWTRLAELEFSFGKTARAKAALTKGLALAPRNAQALALNGFLLAAENRPREAIEWFDRAIATDAALANAWLGRGLCRIRRGDALGGQSDLLVAAALEPRRAQLRSYLGKAYELRGDTEHALHELELARAIDPNDPTALLYSALVKADNSRINEAIDDLEKSQPLNDNRSLYRSSLLLDQDRAVRSVNLARIYRDAGMTEVSVREAARAVSYDYANYSAHLFLANSYDELRDPRRINLRYETPAESEYLIANLLAPAPAGVLSQPVSQQEYSRLFERNRFGVISRTEYTSNGDWLENGAQYGTFGDFSYSLEASYRFDNGQRYNNEFEERVISAKLKQQLTPQDSIYVQSTWYEAGGGDVSQYYSQSQAITDFRSHEHQEPIVSVGYHREWSPGMHTLFLASRLHDYIAVHNPAQPSFVMNTTTTNDRIYLIAPLTASQRYRSELEIYSAELQQILQFSAFTTTAGARWQQGNFDTKNLETQYIATRFRPFFDPQHPSANQDFETDFNRVNAYAYEQWNIFDGLLLVGGVSYDWMEYPENFRAAPISDGEQSISRVSPKAGLVWTPTADDALRFAYTRSIGGVSIDQSTRLEPNQVAGFNQSFRSILPESISGANIAERMETYDISLEHRFPTKTYVGVSAEQLHSEFNRDIGVFKIDFADFADPARTREDLEYTERSLLFTLNQLVGEEWAFGAQYRVARAEVKARYPQVLSTADMYDGFQKRVDLEATLHQVVLQGIYNHRSGFFGQFQALWYGQDNEGYTPSRSGDTLWQFNAFVGYRFFRRKAELTVGVLNLTDEDYRLNPLTLYNELPRERTLLVRLQLSF